MLKKKKENWNSRSTRRHAIESSHQHGSQFFNLTAGTHALIFSLCLADISFWIKQRNAPTVPSLNIWILHLWCLYLFRLHQSCSSGHVVAEVESHGNPKPHTWINTLFVHWKGKLPVYFYLTFVDGDTYLSPGILNWWALEFKWFLSSPWCVWNYWLLVGATKDVHARWFFRAGV